MHGKKVAKNTHQRKTQAKKFGRKLEEDDSADRESKHVVDTILTAEEKHKSMGKAFENARDGAVQLISANSDFAAELLDAFMKQNPQNPYLAWAIVGEVGANHPELFNSALVNLFRDWAAISAVASKAWQKAGVLWS